MAFAIKIGTHMVTVARWETVRAPRGPALASLMRCALDNDAEAIAEIFRAALVKELKLDKLAETYGVEFRFVRNNTTLPKAKNSRPPSGNRKTRFTVAELADRLGVSTDSVYKAVRDGQIPHLRVGKRIVLPVSAIEEWERSGGN